jgi:hypothetical protein
MNDAAIGGLPRTLSLASTSGTKVVLEQAQDRTFKVYLERREEPGAQPAATVSIRTEEGRVGTAFRLSEEGAFMLWTALEQMLAAPKAAA